MADMTIDEVAVPNRSRIALTTAGYPTTADHPQRGIRQPGYDLRAPRTCAT
jgi:hypothetical protein